MIQLEIRRTNSIHGSWLCEAIGSEWIILLDEPIGVGKSIQEALEDYLRSFKILVGYTPEYKWK